MQVGQTPQKINILFIIDGLCLGYGGTERHLLQVIKRLNRDRFSCSVCTLFKGDNVVLQDFIAADCNILNLGIKRIYDLDAANTAFRLAKYIRDTKIDMVQTFGFGSDTYGMLVSRIAGVPTVISSRRDTGYYRNAHRKLASRLAMRFINQVIAVCQAVKFQVVRDESVTSHKVKTIYNGVDLEFLNESEPCKQQRLRTQLGIPQEAFVVGNVSHFRPEKAHGVFFAAIEIIARRVDDLRILAIGVGPLQGHFREYCQRNEILKDIVIFAGGLTNVRDYISLMDVACLCPSKNEGFSNAILEEMAQGKPVIATDVGGNAEAVVDGETGIIVPPNEPDILAEAFLKMYRDPKLRAAMGKKGRERVEKHFTLKKMIENMENLYTELYQRRYS